MAETRIVAAANSDAPDVGSGLLPWSGFASSRNSSPSAEALKKLSIEQLMNLQVTSVSKRPSDCRRPPRRSK